MSESHGPRRAVDSDGLLLFDGTLVAISVQSQFKILKIIY